MAGNAQAVIADRNMNLYDADYASTTTFPADTVNLGALTTPWTNVGYTTEGVTVNIAIERGEIRVDQIMDPILQPITGRTITFTTNLAENTVQNYNRASGLGDITSVAPGPGTRGHDTLVIAGTPADTFVSVLFENRQQNAEAFRGAIWRAIATGSPSATYGSAEDAAVIALELTALMDTAGTPTERVCEFRSVLPAA